MTNPTPPDGQAQPDDQAQVVADALQDLRQALLATLLPATLRLARLAHKLLVHYPSENPNRRQSK